MTYVRDPATEMPLLCCWDDCGTFAHDEFHHDVIEGEKFARKSVRYIFCNARHRLYWMNSHLDNGNLPAGMKNVR